jgi:hypothetical protein
MSKRCRHSKSWLIAGAAIEWCPECGAWRDMQRVPPNSCYPISAWCYPGDDYEDWERRTRAQEKRIVEEPRWLDCEARRHEERRRR